MDERLTYLELRVSEHSAEFRELREAIRHLDQKVDLRFEAVDRRFEAIDRRFETVDGKIDRIRDEIGDKIVCLRDEVRRDLASQLRWVVGIQITTLIAIMGVLLAR